MLFSSDDRLPIRETKISGIRFRRYKTALRMAWRRLSEEDIECAGASGQELARLIEQRHGVARHVAFEHIIQMQQQHLTH